MAYSNTPVTRTSEGMFLKLLLPVCKMVLSRAAPPGLSDARGPGAEGEQRLSCAPRPSVQGAQAGGECCPPHVARTAAGMGRGQLRQLCSST